MLLDHYFEKRLMLRFFQSGNRQPNCSPQHQRAPTKLIFIEDLPNSLTLFWTLNTSQMNGKMNDRKYQRDYYAHKPEIDKQAGR